MFCNFILNSTLQNKATLTLLGVGSGVSTHQGLSDLNDICKFSCGTLLLKFQNTNIYTHTQHMNSGIFLASCFTPSTTGHLCPISTGIKKA